MTILNQNKKISEDYTFIINAEEFFDDNPEIYAYQNNAWSTLTGGAFNTAYQLIQDEILSNNTLTLIPPDADIDNLTDDVYIGVKTSNQIGFPDIVSGRPFITIIDDGTITCMPTKLSSLEGIKIADASTYTPADGEYLSAKQIYNIIGSGGGDGGANISIVTSWETTPSNEKVPSEKLVKDTIDALIGDIMDYIEG